jgi:hypothetical protein
VVAPTTYDVTILVNDVDVTQYVPHESMSFDDYARQVSTFRLRVENPSGVTPTRNHTVVITADSLPDTPVIFNGVIMEVTTKKHGIVTHYELECADQKVRLQKSIIGGNTFAGSDLDILGDLLSNTYPDLSDLFDFSTGITSFADGLELPIEDGTSLLDALDQLADLTGADYRFENGDPDGGVETVTFDTGGYETYTPSADASITASVQTGGNPDNCYKGTAATPTTNHGIFITIDMGASKTITDITFDYYIEATGGTGTGASIRLYDDGQDQFNISDPGIIKSAWTAFQASIDTLWFPPYTDQIVTIGIRCNGTPTDIEFRLDNLIITTAEGYGGSTKNELQWDDEPDAADFDFDIQTGDEYGAEFEFSIGDFDDFNSITVIGGYEEVAIDKALDNDGGRDHIPLPYAVTGLAVYTNGGTDTTPSWGSALALGAWGSDTLTGGGGDKDVLYDAEDRVLFFDTAPPNLVNSYRITGTIRRPIRVRVENIAEGDPTYATSYTDETITSVDQAVAIGQAQLEQKNSIKRITFKTPHPGLKPGQSVNVTDSARGLNETLVIQRISTTWLGASGHATFDVECGDAEETSLDAMIANIDKRTSGNGAITSPSTQSAYLLTDDSGIFLTDDSGSQLYYIG